MRSIPERQLEIVYQQLARTAGFRGFRPEFLLAVAAVATCATGVICLFAARLGASGVALAWTGVAAAIALAVAAAIVLPALRAESSVLRETARVAVIQMLPPLGIGAVVTAVILVQYPGAVAFLPAAWQVLFGLGIAALSPVILARVEYVSIVYFVGAAISFVLRTDDPAGITVLVGVPFVVGHAVTALSLRVTEALDSGGNPHE